MAAARWINPDYGSNRKFLRDHVNRDFDPALCPWTTGACPGPDPRLP
jgi:hypothetical protein